MQLILDENLSFKLVARLKQTFDDVKHVSNLIKFGASDREIWDFARERQAIIVSK